MAETTGASIAVLKHAGGARSTASSGPAPPLAASRMPSVASTGRYLTAFRARGHGPQGDGTDEARVIDEATRDAHTVVGDGSNAGRDDGLS